MASRKSKGGQQRHRKRLEAFYREHAPDKLCNVEWLLNEYAGKEEQLFHDLSKKYAVKYALANYFEKCEPSGKRHVDKYLKKGQEDAVLRKVGEKLEAFDEEANARLAARRSSSACNLHLHSPPISRGTAREPLDFDSPVSPIRKKQTNQNNDNLRRSARIKAQCGGAAGARGSSTRAGAGHATSKNKKRSHHGSLDANAFKPLHATRNFSATADGIFVKSKRGFVGSEAKESMDSDSPRRRAETPPSQYADVEAFVEAAPVSTAEAGTRTQLAQCSASYNFGFRDMPDHKGNSRWDVHRTADKNFEELGASHWKSFQQKHKGDVLLQYSLDLESLVTKFGVPQARRREAWMTWSGASKLWKDGYYQKLCDRSTSGIKEEFLNDVDKDINRPPADHPLFNKNHPINHKKAAKFRREEAAVAPGQVALRRVLLAHLRHNGKIGYSQDMNFLAIFLLLVLGSEECAFWVLTALVQDILPGYFSKGLGGFHTDVAIFKQQLEHRMAKLNAVIAEEVWASVTPRWFMCLFYHTFRPPQLARFWDTLFYAGKKRASAVLIKTALALVEAKRPQLEVAMREEGNAYAEVIKVMQSTVDSKSPSGCAKIFAAADGPLLREVGHLNMTVQRWIVHNASAVDKVKKEKKNKNSSSSSNSKVSKRGSIARIAQRMHRSASGLRKSVLRHGQLAIGNLTAQNKSPSVRNGKRAAPSEWVEMVDTAHKSKRRRK